MGFLFGGGGKKEPDQPAPPPPPQAAAVPPADPEALKRVGRAQLISSSVRGVLGNATTSRKQLSA